MNHNHLLVLERQIMTVSLQVRSLHEEAGQNAFLDVGEKIRRLKRHARQWQLIFGRHANQLIADIISLLERSEVQIILPAPVGVHLLRNESIEGVQHRQVVAVRVHELPLRGVGLRRLVSGSVEDIGDGEQ